MTHHRDSLEDRIHAAGHHDRFTKAIDVFYQNKHLAEAGHILYDELCAIGADAEEADEFINMLMEE